MAKTATAGTAARQQGSTAESRQPLRSRHGSHGSATAENADIRQSRQNFNHLQ